MVELARSRRVEVRPVVKTKIVAAIPCYNTERSIAKVVSQTRKFVDEVIVIDDGSRDMTADMAKAAGALVVPHVVNKGYGEAISSCIAAAQANNADILVIIDGDGQHDPNEIPRLLNPIRRGEADLVIGSRFLAEGKKMPGYRKFGINVINDLWNLGSKTKVTDTQSGFRAYSKKALKDMSFAEKGMGISIEILEKARMSGINIKEVPITCSYENNNATISKKAFSHGFGVAGSVIRIRSRSLFKAK